MMWKVIDRIKELWSFPNNNDDGFQEACHKMNWKCVQDYDYEEKAKGYYPTLYAVYTKKDVYVFEQGKWNEDLEIVVCNMDENVLLDFWEAQLCLKYR